MVGARFSLVSALCLIATACGGGGEPLLPGATPPLCTEIAEGCACRGSEQVSCFDAAPALEGVGLCESGSRTCVDGRWGACERQVLPIAELCGDELDNDCDGSSDEGARCDCLEGCTIVDDGCFATGAMAGLQRDDCSLFLGMRQTGGQWAWIANTQDASVSKIDTLGAMEVGRFASVNDTDHGAPDPAAACPAEQVIANEPTGNCPSRTAVAANGDAFVANRAFGAQATITRIAGDLERCRDRDGDGAVRTSTDLDRDGTISPDPFDGEYLGPRDECILWTVPVGGVGAVARALALGPAAWPVEIGEVWVGLFFERRAVVLDPQQGDVLDDLALDIQPYGAALSPDGRIWFSETDWQTEFGLQAVDTTTHAVEAPVEPPSFDGCTGSYGIAVDEEGRVWRGSSPCAGVFRFDPGSGEWAHFVPDATGESLGVAADGEGRIWAAFFRNPDRQRIARVARLDGTTGETDLFYDLRGYVGDVWGIDVDPEGDVWVVSREDDQALQIDPHSGEITAVPVGDEPYTYSDFTGEQLRIGTDPYGRYEQIVEGCSAGPTSWFDLEVDAEAPVGAGVRVSYRASDDVIVPADVAWTTTHDRRVDLRGQAGRFLEVRVELWSSDDGWTPALHGLSVAYACAEDVE
jgi:streptogramin lyase